MMSCKQPMTAERGEISCFKKKIDIIQSQVVGSKYMYIQVILNRLRRWVLGGAVCFVCVTIMIEEEEFMILGEHKKGCRGEKAERT